MQPTSQTSRFSGTSPQKFFNCSCKWPEELESEEERFKKPCLCQDLAYPFDESSKHFRIIEVQNCRHYVAVSYRWRNTSNDNAECQISRGETTTSAQAPSSVLLRAARFSAKHGYRLLWIDQECINQKDRIDKEHGVQSMDLVYERATVCVAVLDCKISTQSEVERLAFAMKPAPWPKWEDWIEWVEDLAFEKIVEIANIIKRIASDPWFDRSWTFQESSASYGTMLLIECDKSLNCPEYMGTISGEIELPLCAFRLIVSKLSKTFGDYMTKAAWHNERANYIRSMRRENNMHSIFNTHNRHDAMREEALIIASNQLNFHKDSAYQWRQYYQSLVLHTLRMTRHGNRYQCTAAEAISHLTKRFNSVVADRLAIISNLCNFEVRLNGSMLQELGFNLSACIFCLALLNGDTTLARPMDGLRYEYHGLGDLDELTLGIDHGPDPAQRRVDLQVGPELFSWAPWLVESLEDLRYRPERRKKVLYRFSFIGPAAILHIDGWLWKYWQRFDVPEMCLKFKERWSLDPLNAGKKNILLSQPDRGCNMIDCCKMTDVTLLAECYWDIIRYFIKAQQKYLVECIWMSLLISDGEYRWSDEVEMGDTVVSSKDQREDSHLRQRIHSLSYEDFKAHIVLDKSPTKHPSPMFKTVQRIIHSGTLDTWVLVTTSDTQATYAFFECEESIPLFTPWQNYDGIQNPTQSRSLEQYYLSWPIKQSLLSPTDTSISIRIATTDRVRTTCQGFWNPNKVNCQPYALL